MSDVTYLPILTNKPRKKLGSSGEVLPFPSQTKEVLLIETNCNLELLGRMLRFLNADPNLKIPLEDLLENNTPPLLALLVSNHEFWDTVACYELLDDIASVMDSYAPDDQFFGEHPTKPRNFGFWRQ